MKWYCYGCGANKPDPSPGVLCPDGCGMQVTASFVPEEARNRRKALEKAGKLSKKPQTELF